MVTASDLYTAIRARGPKAQPELKPPRVGDPLGGILTVTDPHGSAFVALALDGRVVWTGTPSAFAILIRDKLTNGK